MKTLDDFDVIDREIVEDIFEIIEVYQKYKKVLEFYNRYENGIITFNMFRNIIHNCLNELRDVDELILIIDEDSVNGGEILEEKTMLDTDWHGPKPMSDYVIFLLDEKLSETIRLFEDESERHFIAIVREVYEIYKEGGKEALKAYVDLKKLS